MAMRDCISICKRFKRLNMLVVVSNDSDSLKITRSSSVEEKVVDGMRMRRIFFCIFFAGREVIARKGRVRWTDRQTDRLQLFCITFSDIF